MEGRQFKRNKSNSILFGVVGAILILNAILFNFEGRLFLFFAQLIVGFFAIFLAFWDAQNVFIEFNDEGCLIIKPGLGVPKKVISFKNIEGFEKKSGVRVDLFLTGEPNYPILLRLTEEDRIEFFQLLEEVINEVG